MAVVEFNTTNGDKSMEVKIRTNNKPRDILYWHEISQKARDWYSSLLSSPEDSSFFVYKGETYLLCDFMRVTSPELKGWDGYSSDSFFSGVLVRFVQDGERVVVGMYTS